MLKHQGFVNDPFMRGGDKYEYTFYTFNLVKKIQYKCKKN